MFKRILVQSLCALMFIAGSSCAYMDARNESNDKKIDTASKKESSAVQPTASATDAHTAPVPNKAPASHAAAVPSVSPDQSLQWLKNGNARFVKGRLRSDGATSKDRERLSTGQHPHAIVLSCSDSRVPPEVVFDEKLGEIFTVRNAGEIPDEASLASIEYAVEHLGSKLIVVMGHTQCGAVKAALSTMGGGSAGSPHLDYLVKDIHPRLSAFKGTTASKDYLAEVWAEADGVTKDLILRSAIVREKVEKGEIKIVSAIYHLDSGVVDWK